MAENENAPEAGANTGGEATGAAPAAAQTQTEEITYHAVEKDGQVTAIWEMQGRKHLRTIDPRCARIFLVEAGTRLLGMFDPSLSQKAQRALERLGVEVRVGQAVTQCDHRCARERVAARCVT